MPRSELTDGQWKRIEPLLPPHGHVGRPRVEDRKVVEGILYVLRTGCRWQDMPREYGAYVTAWRRRRRWEDEGIWERIWQALLGTLDEEGKIEWARAFLDGSFVPAKKGGEEVELTKVGKGTKRMLVTDGNGTPRGLLASRANCAEIRLATATMKEVRVPRRRGRPRKRPRQLIADKAYDCDEFRAWLRRKGVIPRIPPRKNRTGRRKTWDEEYNGGTSNERSPGSGTSGACWRATRG